MHAVKVCATCGGKFSLSEYDWLKNQQKYHGNCKSCTKENVAKALLPLKGRPKKN